MELQNSVTWVAQSQNMDVVQKKFRGVAMAKEAFNKRSELLRGKLPELKKVETNGKSFGLERGIV